MRQWQELTASVRGSAEDAVLLSLYHDRRDAEFVVETGLDGAYTYFASDGFTEGSTSSGWAEARRRLTAAGKLFVASVGPGYDDTRIRPWNAHNTRARARGAYYDRMWSVALDAAPHAISITSYNEWGEGTQIEGARPHASAAGLHSEDYQPEVEQFYMLRTRQWVERARRNCGSAQVSDSEAHTEL